MSNGIKMSNNVKKNLAPLAWAIGLGFILVVIVAALASNSEDEWTDTSPPSSVAQQPAAPEIVTPEPRKIRPAPTQQTSKWSEAEHTAAMLVVQRTFDEATPSSRTSMCYAYDYSPSMARSAFVSEGGDYGALLWIYFEEVLQNRC